MPVSTYSELGFYKKVHLKSQSMVTRNSIVCKLARGYCLCYCKTFSLVADSTECAKIFLTEKCSAFLCHLKSGNIVGLRKTTNKEKHFCP